MDKKKIVLALGSWGLAVAPLAVEAESVPIRLNKTSDIEWSDPSTWEGGVVPSTGATIDFNQASSPIDAYSYLRLPPSALSVDAIVGSGANFYLYMPWYGERSALFGVREISGWNSIQPIGSRGWTTARALCGFSLEGSEESPTQLPNLFGGYRPEIAVPEGRAGVVNALWNRGVFDKSGGGKLTVKLPIDENIALNVRGGTLALTGGTAVSSDAQIAPGAYIHLDASDETSIETAEGTDTVVAWRDPVSGRAATELSADKKWSEAQVSPTLDRTRTVNGHPLVKFGMLALPEMRFDVREVFVVLEAESLDNDKLMIPVGCDGWTVRNFYLDRKFSGTDYSQNGLINFYGRENVQDAQLGINGNPVPWTLYPSDPSKLRVVSFSFEANRIVSVLGGDRNNNNFGGFRAAEFVVYTRELTAAERRQTIAALKRRWLGDGSTHDVGIVKVSAPDVKIEVPEGEVATIRTLNDLGGYGIVKTGKGELVLDRVQPNSARIEVREGKVRFNRQTAVPTEQAEVAADPLFHLDADNAASLSDEDGVVAWHDVRSDVDFSANLYAGADRPTVIAASPTGKNVLDFGNRLDSNGPRLQFSSVKNVYEGFIVWRNIYSASDAQNLPAIFGSAANAEWRYQSRGYLFNRWYNNRFVESSVWTVNGTMVNADSSEFGTSFGGGEKGLVVIHFAATAPQALGGVADSFNSESVSRGGGCQVAEFIGYDRLLTDKERRATEAALMHKWLGVSHPDEEGWSGTLDFATGTPAVIEADGETTIGTVNASGVLIKTGEGSASVDRVTGVDGYEVRSGVLSAQEDMMADAYFHVDAADAKSLVFAEGAEQGLVARWNDVRGNGRYAEALVYDIGNGEQNLKYPLLGTASVPGLTEGLPYVDFRECARPAAYATTPCSSMRWVDEHGSTDGSTKIREVHIVYCEDFAGIEAGHDIGVFMGTSNWFNGQRGIGYQFLRAGLDWYHIFAFSDSTQHAWMRMDGVGLPKDSNGVGDNYSCAMSENRHLHVLSISSTDYDLEANAFCNDRGNCGAGGYKICEAVIFTGNTNSTEKFQAINDYLCKKWRDIGSGGSYSTLTTLQATGGTLNLSGATGTIAPKDGANLSFAFKSAEDYGKIVVSSDFVVPETGTITVTLPQAGEARPAEGSYVLLQADRFVGAENFANWTIVADTTAGYRAKVKVNAEKGQIVLTIAQTGSVILIR